MTEQNAEERQTLAAQIADMEEYDRLEALGIRTKAAEALTERRTETIPQPAEGLRQHLAEAMAKEAGSKAFREPGSAWDHARSEWLAHADAAVNALRRWEEEGTLVRLCTIPSCFRQLNIAAPEPGWLQSSAVGYMCPDHAPILWAGPDGPHVPRWTYIDADRPALLVCSCGWDAGRTRFRGHGTVLWQAHALDIQETAA